MHGIYSVVPGWFGLSSLWLFVPAWRLVRAVLPGGEGWRGIGMKRLWAGCALVLLASCTLEALCLHIAGSNAAGQAINGVLARQMHHRFVAPLMMAAVLVASLPWLLGWRWADCATWVWSLSGNGARRKETGQHRSQRVERADYPGYSSSRVATGENRHTIAGYSLSGKSRKRWQRPESWQPPSDKRKTAAPSSANPPPGVVSSLKPDAKPVTPPGARKDNGATSTGKGNLATAVCTPNAQRPPATAPASPAAGTPAPAPQTPALTRPSGGRFLRRPAPGRLTTPAPPRSNVPDRPVPSIPAQAGTGAASPHVAPFHTPPAAFSPSSANAAEPATMLTTLRAINESTARWMTLATGRTPRDGAPVKAHVPAQTPAAVSAPVTVPAPVAVPVPEDGLPTEVLKPAATPASAIVPDFLRAVSRVSAPAGETVSTTATADDTNVDALDDGPDDAPESDRDETLEREAPAVSATNGIPDATAITPPVSADVQTAVPPQPRGHSSTSFEFRPLTASSVRLPTLDLLERTDTSIEPVSDEALAATGRLIEQRLQEFKVPVTVVGASAGPVITRFEIDPAQGVRGSQIVGLMKDLSRGLGLTSIRVVETIPGKTCMGLELPNPRRQIIRLCEIFESPQWQRAASKLTLALGKDIVGQPVVTDLAKAPHMLVAGTTGSGKSVAINVMILSLLYKATPEQVRLIMIDPKMLELSAYEGIPHLLAPVVTDMKLAANALHWCVDEMEKRYRLMSAVGVRNLAGFNQKIRDAIAQGQKIGNPFSLTPEAPEPLGTLPVIVVVIDELADLMMVVGKKVEELIARLAQKARAAGIHLILATQRPSVDVITGLIKANIPTRIAFQVSSKVDSRTILDQMGAETLLGMGDMLFLPPGTGYPQRIHGAFVADEEVHHVVEYLKQFGAPEYVDGILDSPAPDAQPDLFGDAPDAEADPLYDEAVAFVIRTRRVSISAVQRQLRIGYNRAARLVEQMETAGLVSPMGVNGSREVIAPATE